MKTWEKSNAEIFWGEIAPCDHVIQIYDNDEEILNSLENFIDSGINAGDSVVIIATDNHIDSLNKRLKKKHDLESLRTNDLYIPLSATDTLSKFMSVGWPNEKLFVDTISGIITRARGKDNRRIRAYGEMVAILWSQGYNGATVQLEHLWNNLCKTETFCLFCAYPKSGFTQDIHQSIGHICSMHTKIVSGENNSKTEIFYKTV